MTAHAAPSSSRSNLVLALQAACCACLAVFYFVSPFHVVTCALVAPSGVILLATVSLWGLACLHPPLYVLGSVLLVWLVMVR
jgi:hypothetical protein